MNLLVSDYDGTFYTTEKGIKMNVEKIKEFIENGNLFMLSSGRSYNSLMNKVEEYHIPFNYLATEDGSHLFDHKGSLIHEDLLDRSIITEIGDILALNRHYDMQYGTTREYYSTDKGYPTSSINLILQEDMIDKKFTKEWKKLEKKHNEEYEFLVYGYASIYYYCIKTKGIDKNRPIEKLSEILNLGKENIFVVGDGDNDTSMIINNNGYMIGDNESLKKCSLKCYNEVYEIVEDIEKQKIKRRW